MNCLRMYGTPAFHIGTLNRYRPAESKRRKASIAAAHARALSPVGAAPAQTLLLAAGAAGPNSGRVPSHRSQVSISISGCASAKVSRNVVAMSSDSDATPRGEAAICKSLRSGGALMVADIGL